MTRLFIKEGFDNVTEDLSVNDRIKSDISLVALDDALGLKIMDLIRKNPDISQEDLAVELKVTRRTVQRKMEELKKRKQIERKGGKRFGHWEINNPQKSDE